MARIKGYQTLMAKLAEYKQKRAELERHIELAREELREAIDDLNREIEDCNDLVLDMQTILRQASMEAAEALAAAEDRRDDTDDFAEWFWSIDAAEVGTEEAEIMPFEARTLLEENNPLPGTKLIEEAEVLTERPPQRQPVA